MRIGARAIGPGVLLAGAAGWSGSTPIVLASSPAINSQAQQLNGRAAVNTALKQLGVQYVAGGARPSTGFDDVGFVQWVYAQQGINLPSNLTDMRTMARRIHATGLHPGHLVFFKNTVYSGLSHVGIWVGNGRFVHAEWYTYGVTLTWLKDDPKDGSYWASHYLGRLNRPNLPSGPGAPSSAVGERVFVTVAALNARTQPWLLAPVVTVLRQGTPLAVSATQHGWIHVSVSGREVGWVMRRYTSAGQ